MKSYRQTALAIALCAFAGTVAAQSYPSTTTPMKDQAPTATQPSTSAPVTPGGQPMSPATRAPSRTDSADTAYKSLDASNRGYLSKSDVQGISGFNFDQADTNQDGRLTKDEFAKAWAVTK